MGTYMRVKAIVFRLYKIRGPLSLCYLCKASSRLAGISSFAVVAFPLLEELAALFTCCVTIFKDLRSLQSLCILGRTKELWDSFDRSCKLT